MITIFNRAEVAVTYDLQRQSDISNALKSQGIDYYLKVRNTLRPRTAVGGNRSRVSSAGTNVPNSYEYKFYVKRCDYDKAMQIINTCR